MEYNENTIDDAFWSRIFSADVTAGEPQRIGAGQVGMNLRYPLSSTEPSVPQSVVVKLASPDPTSRATGVALRNYEREVKFYNEVVSTIAVRSPHCYFAEWNETNGDIVIVLEDMAPCEQGDQIRGCGVDEARTAVAELVKMHGPRWNDSSLFSIDWLQRRNPDDVARTQGLYSMVKSGFLTTYELVIREELGDEGLAFINDVEALMPQYMASKTEPYTVTHGDYRLDNLLFATEAGGVACAVVDWQTPGHGNGIGDLAYFIGAGLLPDDRARHEWELVDQYIAGIESYGHIVDHDWVKTQYRREAISGVIMAVIASQIVGRTERGDKMFEVMATRHIRQGLHNNALSLL